MGSRMPYKGGVFLALNVKIGKIAKMHSAWSRYFPVRTAFLLTTGCESHRMRLERWIRFVSGIAWPEPGAVSGNAGAQFALAITGPPSLAFVLWQFFKHAP